MGALKVKKNGTFQAVGGEGPWYSTLPGAPSNTGSASVPAGTSAAHTKGAWTELIASTSALTTALLVRVTGVANTATDTAGLIDIGVGAAGSETAVIPNVAVGGASSANDGGVYFMVPVKVASGSRISARYQSKNTDNRTATVEVFAFNVGGSDAVPTSVDVLGTSTATSEGTAMSGVSGTYVQVTASTSAAYRALVVVPSSSATSIGTIGINYTVAAGAAGSEVDIGTIRVLTSSNESVASYQNGMLSVFPCVIPSGTRVSVKHNIGSSPGNYDVCVIGIPAV
jgi:hypothetical protein